MTDKPMIDSEATQTREDVSTINVYGQPCQHDHVYIAGNRQALERLMVTIHRALDFGAARASVFATDGEGYEIEVRQVAGDQLGRLAVPYTEDCARESREEAVWPWQI